MLSEMCGQEVRRYSEFCMKPKDHKGPCGFPPSVDADVAWKMSPQYRGTMPQVRKAGFLAGFAAGVTVGATQADLLALLRVGPRFWTKVDVRRSTSECWPWQGAVTNFGHGQIAAVPFPLTTAHRMAWALTNGRMPASDEVVRHKCDNPPCCNPNHLLIGTQAENAQDSIERGRAHWQGETCRAGHPRTPENAKYDKNGVRRCVECDKATQLRRSGPWTCPTCGDVLTERHRARHMRTKHPTARATSTATEGGNEG